MAGFQCWFVYGQRNLNFLKCVTGSIVLLFSHQPILKTSKSFGCTLVGGKFYMPAICISSFFKILLILVYMCVRCVCGRGEVFYVVHVKIRGQLCKLVLFHFYVGLRDGIQVVSKHFYLPRHLRGPLTSSLKKCLFQSVKYQTLSVRERRLR